MFVRRGVCDICIMIFLTFVCIACHSWALMWTYCMWSIPEIRLNTCNAAKPLQIMGWTRYQRFNSRISAISITKRRAPPQSLISSYPISLQIRFHLLSGCVSSGKFLNLLEFPSWHEEHCLPAYLYMGDKSSYHARCTCMIWSRLHWLPLNSNTSRV